MKPRVRRWTRADVPAPWEYRIQTVHGMVRGHTTTWRRAFDRALQIIAET